MQLRAIFDLVKYTRYLHKMQEQTIEHVATYKIGKEIRNFNKRSYNEAIEMLNNLQSNADYLKQLKYNHKLSHSEEHSRTITQVEKYLLRCGITFEKLNKLSVIHLSGTKGKGSTCAFCEGILRQHGYKTGFYSSPHLFEVRERIRINGKPISSQKFADNFWKIYDMLDMKKSDSSDMPLYFRFLTILALSIFLEEKVDVAIIEVGIGGRFDCTNVLRKVPLIGITSLGIDHTSLLGETIEEIAWHKAGIMKKDGRAFTVPQPENALKVLSERSTDLECPLTVIQEFITLQRNGSFIPKVLNTNASLAVVLTHAWITMTKGVTTSLDDFANATATQRGLKNFFWPGRYQIIQSHDSTFYLDGAHTLESIKVCINWFKEETKYSTKRKILIFNTTGDRDAALLLNLLHACNFSMTYFVPNVAGQTVTADTKIAADLQMNRCQKHKDIWLSLNKNNMGNDGNAIVFRTITDALNHLNYGSCDVLITGSLHLIGASLMALGSKLDN